MPSFFFPCKRKKIIKALQKLGLELKEGNKHTKAMCIHNGRFTTIPRHKNIKREIVHSICNFLLEKDFNEKEMIEMLH